MANIVGAIESNETLRSATRFIAVGIVGTLIDLLLFSGLNLILGVPALLANTLSYSAGIVNNYLFHRNWTFAVRPRKAAKVQFAQFLGISLSALIVNNVIVLLLAPTFSALSADPAHGAIIAKICATGVGMGWNFFANHLWTFRANEIGY
jgi:putative flippase GtrA